MKLREIVEILDAQVLTCEEMIDDIDINAISAADMMSEVLAYSQDESLLLTGLITPQVVRTAQMMDLAAVMFVRGKQPSEETMRLSTVSDIPLLVTNELLYSACGKLYVKEIPGCK